MMFIKGINYEGKHKWASAPPEASYANRAGVSIIMIRGIFLLTVRINSKWQKTV